MKTEKANTCCTTGPRLIDESNCSAIRFALSQEIQSAIAQGYRLFLFGFDVGTDLLFAQEVIAQKRKYPILLEAVLPDPSRVKTADALFHHLLSQCDAIQVYSPQFSHNCVLARNQYMADHSSRIIAVSGKQTFGIAAETISYATQSAMDIRLINLVSGTS